MMPPAGELIRSHEPIDLARAEPPDLGVPVRSEADPGRVTAVLASAGPAVR
jgi:hypothetical protein